jgi:hypothetical protein
MTHFFKFYNEHPGNPATHLLGAFERRVEPWIRRRTGLFRTEVPEAFALWEAGKIASWEMIEAFHRFHPGSHAADGFDHYGHLWAKKHERELKAYAEDAYVLWERNLLSFRRMLRAYWKNSRAAAGSFESV